MPAKTPTDKKDEYTNDKVTNGWTKQRFIFSSIDDTDTWTSGISNIRRVAWEATLVSDQVAVTVAPLTGIVTFNAAADNLNGALHVWSGGTMHPTGG